ncbi:MAG: MmcQ/YjbR family DNA-binding protein [Pedococcus sp.]
MAVTVDDVRRIAAPLPRAYEVLVRDRVKFRVGSIVWLAFSRDETEMGFAFPREERAALVQSEPEIFFMPGQVDMRYQWVEAWTSALEVDRLTELVLDAWAMVVPKSVSAPYFAGLGVDR